MFMSSLRSFWRRIRWKPRKSLALQLAEEFGGKKADSVELVYWSPGGGVENFGDYLSYIIVTKILADAGLFLNQAVSRRSRLLTIGSILHMARDGDTIWGSGVNGLMKLERHTFAQLDVRAVRGPRTRDFLMERGVEVPEVYGDPALLCGDLLPQWRGRKKTRHHVFVPNMHDLRLTRGWSDVVSPFEPWNHCFDKIVSSEFVMASSLHGLIIAESYGIPARYVRLTETEGLVKYEDHILSTGRPKLEFARSVDEALEMGGMPPPKFDTEKLLAAFPIDLWGKDAGGQHS
jgi:pyruvyltransferase